MIIDSHQHYWKLKRGDYFWLKRDMELLYRDYLPDDLAPLLKATDVQKTIIIQATNTIAETEYLLKLSQSTSSVLGVVGWIEMDSENAVSTLKTLSKDPKFLGIRPMLQELSDDQWILQECLEPALRTLAELKLTFDALVFTRHLDSIYKLSQSYPSLKIVIDHAAKPGIKNNEFASWSEKINLFKNQKNVYCKISGLLTEAPFGCSFEIFTPYIERLFQVFGAKRLMWGSDWPVLNISGNYTFWYKMTRELLSSRNNEDQDYVFGKTAALFYGEMNGKT